jgi:uncharacterized protein (DUF1499 family)
MIGIIDAINTISIFKNTQYKISDKKTELLKDIFVVMPSESDDLDENEAYIQFLFKSELNTIFINLDIYLEIQEKIDREDDLYKIIKERK